MRTIDETRGLSTMNLELERMGSANQVETWTMASDIKYMRSAIAGLRDIIRPGKPRPSTLPYAVRDIQIPMRDGASILARVYTPRKKPLTGFPCMYVCHGGGYILGDPETEERLCGLFATLGGVVVDAIYRHAPEHPFPLPVLDSYDGLKWLASNLSDFGVNPQLGFLVAGEAVAGADIALVIAHLYCCEDKLSPPLTGLYIAAPQAMSHDTVPEKYKDYFLSMGQNAKSPVLTAESIAFMNHMYKPDPSSPLAYPILFKDHSALPKVYLQICGMDPLRDGGLILEQVLRESGVDVKTDVYPGLPHVFWAVYIHARFTKQQLEDSRAGLNWLLGK